VQHVLLMRVRVLRVLLMRVLLVRVLLMRAVTTTTMTVLLAGSYRVIFRSASFRGGGDKEQRRQR
jgi:hypothetical protein